MSTKELAYRMIDSLTEEQLNALVVILSSMQRDEPNEETLAAMKDVEENKNLHGPFDTLTELWEDLDA
jgi:hypothetical protein